MTRPVVQTIVLRMLEKDGPLTVLQIIEKTGRTNVKHTVHDLCNKRGYIARADNRNAPTYVITDAGRTVLAGRKAENKVARIVKEMAPRPVVVRRSTPNPPPRPAAVAVTTAETKITIAATIPRPHYEGAELRAFDGRPGAMRAYGLPSRGIGA